MLRRLSYGLFAVFLFITANVLATDAMPSLRLSTTTSTENSGLLKVLLPAFEKKTGYKVQVIAVGTGKALKMGENGDVDVVLAHARGAEDKFIADGHGVNRRDVMYNDFLIVGAKDDPAGIKGLSDAAEALKKIQAKKAVFVSRGDKSGTHEKELELWQAAGVKPTGEWYREAGQGMGEVLQMSGELSAYTIVDRGTWLAYKTKSPLVELVQGDKRLFNPYGVMAVNPEKFKDINYMGAMSLIAWLTSVEGQTLIHDFTINNEALFIPTAIHFDK
ncbi:ABC-type tungstate transport system, permease component [Beggiatoa alba B18LD]|uniref:ABC-type tungstate transport system, permease component n=1 Tax=Beggiatoa alba B18LD TaxID=395493 RepID=I3CBU9_9GAMM|nr:substrate-binding domain-containing protein [Beggiatoa alba]EIJ41092.1 ABC-type tungstate transport system, permease component [Beggiatoa alba B18LD]